MNRRSALQSLALSSMALALPHFSFSETTNGSTPLRKGSFSLDGNKIRFTHPSINSPFSLTLIADTHLFRDDQRGAAFTQYSQRMAKAYNKTKHFQTGQDTDPETAFIETLNIAAANKSSLVALVGDIFSFPSEAAVEWVQEKMESSGLKYVYTAGNHDWHYEGMEGTSEQLRDTWIKNRLSPLYNGNDPMMQKIELNGVNLLILDNSTYQITKSQLDFFRRCLSDNKPTVLMVHIPLYAPGRPVGFGCGHPDWGAQTDRGFKLERRPQWPETGHTKTTLEFYEKVLHAENLLGVLAGHIHNQSVDVINGIPQVVSEANAEGGYLQVDFTS
jgi:predicted phosphodiesterase